MAIYRNTALTEPVDILLADVAIRVQLSRTDYEKAVARYETMARWIDREDSPLRGRVELVYAQGSMAVGATIASRLRTDEFDIDILAQLGLPYDVDPQTGLDLLHGAIRGQRGSRYYDNTRRQTRCVTIDYADDMHIDVTPAVRRSQTPERESLIFHHRPEDPGAPRYRLVANPYGFAAWFTANTPLDHDFTRVFDERAAAYERAIILAEKAESDPLPAQEPPYRKSKAVIVLQLLKRWRNVRYDNRPGRRPPSIMMARLVADAANHTERLADELLHQARHMRGVLQQWHDAGLLIHVANPVCEQDVLTDRWPADWQDQAEFIDDLDDRVRKVERLVAGCDLAEMQAIMADLFGEVPTAEAFRVFNEQMGGRIRDGQSRHRPGSGRLDLAASGIATGAAAPSVAQATPQHRFFGGERRKR